MGARSWRERANLTAGALGKKGFRSIQFQTACSVGDTFDPTITLRAGCPYTPQWDFGNGDTATGTDITYTDFADAGPHTVTLTIPNISYWLTGIDVYSDKIVGDFLAAISKCTSLQTIGMGENTDVEGDLSSLVGLKDLVTLNIKEHQASIVGDIANLAGLSNLSVIYIAGCGIHGDVASLAGMTQLTKLDLHSHVFGGGVGIYGDLADITTLVNLTQIILGNTLVGGDIANLNGMTSLWRIDLYGLTAGTGLVTGSLSDIAALDGVKYYDLRKCSITGGDLGSNPLTEYLLMQDLGWAQATVDAFIEALYVNRAIYTGVAYGQRHTLNISGTNAAPSGVYQDATPPTTGLEYVYKLANDPDAEGFKQWNITYTGGAVP